MIIKKEFIISNDTPINNTLEDEETPLSCNNKEKRKQLHIDNSLNSIILCPNISASQPCPFQDNCKYSHNVEEYLTQKPQDLGNICPNISACGYCIYGIKCRFYSGHDSIQIPSSKHNPNEMNSTSSSLLESLRKRKYTFKALQDENYSTNDLDTLPIFSTEPRIPPKKIDFRNKLYLAPLTTVGNLPYRRICKEFGVDITCGEMALALNLIQGHKPEWALLKRHVSEDIFGVQICGSNPEIMSKCIQVIDNETKVDFIDINMGCPIDLIYEKGMGSALLDRPSRVESILHAINNSNTSIPITVKLRTGIQEGKNTIAQKLIPRIIDTKCVSMITVHGRTRQQRYSKLADWDYIYNQCCPLVSDIPMFGNGDCFTFEDYNRHTNNGVDGVLIARGALVKPWIFTEIKEQRHWDISATERLEILKRYCQYGMEHFGSDDSGIEKTRKFLLEWISFLYRYVPIGLIEVMPQRLNERPPRFMGRSELETLLASDQVKDWIKITEMFLGPVSNEFTFVPKHKANSYQG